MDGLLVQSGLNSYQELGHRGVHLPMYSQIQTSAHAHLEVSLPPSHRTPSSQQELLTKQT